MEVDVESEDGGSDKDAEGEVVNDEDNTIVKRKSHKDTTFRPKPLAKAPVVATRSSKRLKVEVLIPTSSIVSSRSGTSSSDTQDLGALLKMKSSSCMCL